MLGLASIIDLIVEYIFNRLSFLYNEDGQSEVKIFDLRRKLLLY